VKTRILIVDDHAILRAGLRIFLSDQTDMDVIAEAGDSHEAMQAIARSEPNLVTLDLSLPGEGGLSLLKRIRATHPQVRVLVLTMHDDAAYLKAAEAAGASGYVIKTAAEAELLAAIRAIGQGQTHFDLRATATAGERASESAEEADDDCGAASSTLNLLSEREREVLAMVARGLTNQQIAAALYLSVKTIETYRSRLMVKLRLQSRADLVSYALQHGLLQSAVCTASP
jgi:two-component system response regulator NreC